MNQFVSGLNAVAAGLNAATAATAQLSVSLKRLSTLEREMVKAPRRARTAKAAYTQSSSLWSATRARLT